MLCRSNFFAFCWFAAHIIWNEGPSLRLSNYVQQVNQFNILANATPPKNPLNMASFYTISTYQNLYRYGSRKHSFCRMGAMMWGVMLACLDMCSVVCLCLHFFPCTEQRGTVVLGNISTRRFDSSCCGSTEMSYILTQHPDDRRKHATFHFTQITKSYLKHLKYNLACLESLITVTTVWTTTWENVIENCSCLHLEASNLIYLFFQVYFWVFSSLYWIRQMMGGQ